MSQNEKKINRLLSIPTDYQWSELVALLRSFEFEWKSKSGSHGRFLNERTKQQIRLAKPHGPSHDVPLYALRIVIDALRDEGYIERDKNG